MTEPKESELSYEQARGRLTEVVAKLESGGVGLAESMKLWEEGERLAKICQQHLDDAKAQVDRALVGNDPDAEQAHVDVEPDAEQVLVDDEAEER